MCQSLSLGVCVYVLVCVAVYYFFELIRTLQYPKWLVMNPVLEQQ